MTFLKEGLKAGDLDGVVAKRFSVDQFKSKMGDDRNIMVLAFSVDGQAPAKDLERFAETGYKEVLDADATPGTLEDGKHRVFIEFARVEQVNQHIRRFLDDLSNCPCSIRIGYSGAGSCKECGGFIGRRFSMV